MTGGASVSWLLRPVFPYSFCTRVSSFGSVLGFRSSGIQYFYIQKRRSIMDYGSVLEVSWPGRASLSSWLCCAVMIGAPSLGGFLSSVTGQKVGGEVSILFVEVVMWFL